jgi:hypothetical protein
LGNAKLKAEEAARSGRYTLTADARQMAGRAVARLLTIIDTALPEFAGEIAAKSDLTQRDALILLKSAWHSIRMREAKRESAEAAATAKFVEDDA